MLDPSAFLYNQKESVVLTVHSERVQDDTTIQDVAYASPLGGLVSGYLIVSPKSRPQAGLIFGHWGEGNREEFVDEAVILARLGFVSFCLDASFRRPVEYEPQQDPPQADLQWVVDVCRAVDLLLDRFELVIVLVHPSGESSPGLSIASKPMFSWQGQPQLQRSCEPRIIL